MGITAAQAVFRVETGILDDQQDYQTFYNMQSEQGVYGYESTAEGLRQRVSVVTIKTGPWGVTE